MLVNGSEYASIKEQILDTTLINETWNVYARRAMQAMMIILMIYSLWGRIAYSDVHFLMCNTCKKGEIRRFSFVNPHEVSSYTRKDGTFVRGYWRDGDGNPFLIKL